MTKLLFFASDYSIGLSTLLTDQLLALYHAELPFIAVAGEKEQEAGLGEKVQHLNLELYRISGLDTHRNFHQLAKQIADIIRKKDIGFVHVQNNWQLVLVTYAKCFLLKRPKPKVIYTLHGFRHNHPIKAIIAKMIIGMELLCFADRVICMSSYLKKQFQLLSYKIELIPLGIPDDYFKVEHTICTNKGLQMLFPAQFRYGKNQDLIIRAFANHIKKTGDSVSRLILPGSGPLWDEMKKLASNMGIENRVVFPGQCTKEEVLRLYMESNIGIIASNSETFGQCIVEPFVLGRCIISTSVGIAPDIIKDGENGYLYKSENELTAIMGWLYSSPSKIEEAGCNNYEQRNLFRWNAITKQYIEMLERI